MTSVEQQQLITESHSLINHLCVKLLVASQVGEVTLKMYSVTNDCYHLIVLCCQSYNWQHTSIKGILVIVAILAMAIHFAFATSDVEIQET